MIKELRKYQPPLSDIAEVSSTPSSNHSDDILSSSTPSSDHSDDIFSSSPQSASMEPKLIYEDADGELSHSDGSVTTSLCPIADIKHRYAVKERLKMAKREKLGQRKRNVLRWLGVTLCFSKA